MKQRITSSVTRLPNNSSRSRALPRRGLMGITINVWHRPEAASPIPRKETSYEKR